MIIRLADRPPQPWKNGLGRTREIAVQPSGAGMDDFLWRVSVAEVDSAAPFSAFPGIDRVIVLLDGAGFTMTLDGARTHALTVPCTPFAFPGEAKVDVALAGGPTRDFNLMLRRGHATGGVAVWRQPGEVNGPGDVVLLHVAQGRLTTPDGTLAAGDSWRPDSRAAPPVKLADDTVVLAVRVQAGGR